MKILVTGANGYLGQGIVKQLLDDGIVVVATDFSSERIDKRAIIKTCDLFTIENPYEFFDEPDVVLHLAWKNGFVHNAESHISDLFAHYAFLKKIIGSGVKRLAVMGTMHEIGFYEGCIDENTPCNPQSFYGIAKNALRGLVSLLCEDAKIKMQWLRGFYIVGNTESGNSIFSKIASLERQGEVLFPFNKGTSRYDFLDYSDFCLRLAACVEQDDVNGIINVCSGHPQSLKDRVEQFLKENNYSIKMDYGKYPERPYDSKGVWGDSSKIEAIMLKRDNNKQRV